MSATGHQLRRRRKALAAKGVVEPVTTQPQKEQEESAKVEKPKQEKQTKTK